MWFFVFQERLGFVPEVVKAKSTSEVARRSRDARGITIRIEINLELSRIVWNLVSVGAGRESLSKPVLTSYRGNWSFDGQTEGRNPIKLGKLIEYQQSQKYQFLAISALWSLPCRIASNPEGKCKQKLIV